MRATEGENNWCDWLIFWQGGCDRLSSRYLQPDEVDTGGAA